MSGPGAIPVAILAGGLATRLRPVTKTIAKAMVEVAGEPFIAHQLRLLRRQGVRRVVLLVGHLGEQVQRYVGDGSRFGLDVAYRFDGDRLLGTGGAIRAALPLLGERFGITYGDTLLDLALERMIPAWEASGAPALMSVFRNEKRWDSSNASFDGARVRYDKRAPTDDMDYIDYGFGLLTAGLFAPYPEGEPFDLADLYKAASDAGALAGFAVSRRFYEIGSHAGLAETEDYVRSLEMSDATSLYYSEALAILQQIDHAEVDRMVDILAETRAGGGRLFIVGSGGGAGHASHAVNDFRKICGIESYAPSDNVSELTARVNDEGWDTAYSNWLKVSRINAKDAVLVFSVGGGNEEKNISRNLVEAVKLAKSVGAKVMGVVGRDGGYTKQVADACVVIATVNPATVTPHTEAFQAVVWHGMVSHPKLQANETKWESTR